MQDKTPRNEQGEPHGHWEIYLPTGELWYMEHYINGVVYGYAIYIQARLSNGESTYIKEYYAR
jgi:hypothetical protein